MLRTNRKGKTASIVVVMVAILALVFTMLSKPSYANSGEITLHANGGKFTLNLSHDTYKGIRGLDDQTLISTSDAYGDRLLTPSVTIGRTSYEAITPPIDSSGRVQTWVSWNTKQDGSGTTYQITPLKKEDLPDDVTDLWAQYETHFQYITYWANGGSAREASWNADEEDYYASIHPNNSGHTYRWEGSTYRYNSYVAGPYFEREGFVQTGWNSKRNGTGVDLPFVTRWETVFQNTAVREAYPAPLGTNSWERMNIYAQWDYLIAVQKTWSNDQEGERPDSVTAVVKDKDGQALTEVKLTKEDNWTALARVPEYKNGTKVDITDAKVEEKDVPKGYQPSYDNIGGTTSVIDTYSTPKSLSVPKEINHTITNTKRATTIPEYVSLKVYKEWKDDDNKDGKRPDSIEVKIFANGEDSGKTITLKKGEDDGNVWVGTSEDLDKHDADGKEITYSVAEADVPAGYTSSVKEGKPEDDSLDNDKIEELDDPGTINYTITNTYTPEESTPEPEPDPDKPEPTPPTVEKDQPTPTNTPGKVTPKPVTKVVKTGDETALLAYFILAFLSMAVIVCAVRRRKGVQR